MVRVVKVNDEMEKEREASFLCNRYDRYRGWLFGRLMGLLFTESDGFGFGPYQAQRVQAWWELSGWHREGGGGAARLSGLLHEQHTLGVSNLYLQGGGGRLG